MCCDYYYMSIYIHPKYTDGNKILDLFEEYKKERDNLNLPYEFSGVLTKLGIIQETWDDYKACNLAVEGITEDEIKGFKERSSAIKKIESECASSLAEWGLQNPKSQAMAMFLLKQKRNGGYTDKQEFTTTGNVQIAVKLTDEKGKTIK